PPRPIEIAPAAISATPPITTRRLLVEAPTRPAARANGVVRPSDIPRMRSRTTSPRGTCHSGCLRPTAIGLSIVDSVRSRQPPLLRSGARDEVDQLDGGGRAEGLAFQIRSQAGATAPGRFPGRTSRTAPASSGKSP